MLLFGKISLRLAAFLFGMGITLPGFAAITNPVITLTAQVPATVNSPVQTNPLGYAVTCVFNQASHTSSPSTLLSIQGRDPGGSGLYYTIITSAAIVADNTPTPVAHGKGVQATANISSSLPVPPAWRVQLVISGTGTVTGTVGCVLN